MAGSQALSLTSTFTAPQSNPHRYHAHRLSSSHHHHRTSRPVSMETDDCSMTSSPDASSSSSSSSSSSAAAAAFSQSQSQSSKPFPVSVAPPGVRLRRRPDATTTTSGDDDSSAASCLRSEWVTLSKAMLMVLVEKICQLSFEGEPTPTPTPTPTLTPTLVLPPGLTASGLRGSTSSSHPRNNDDAEMITMSCRRHYHRPNDAHNNNTDEAPETTNDETTTTTTTTSSSVPVRRKSSDDVNAAIEETSEDVSNQVPALAPCPANASSPSPSDLPNPLPPSSKTSSASSSGNRSSGSPLPKVGPKSSWKRGSSSRLHHQKLSNGGRVEKREARRRKMVEDSVVVRKPKVIGQRHADGNVQSWVACNKSLVFRMIDSALGTPDAQQVPSANTCAVTPGVSEDSSGTVVTSRDVTTKPSCVTSSSSLLGALLSYDDESAAAREDAPPLDAPGSNLNAGSSFSYFSGGSAFSLLGRKRADAGTEESVSGGSNGRGVDRRRRPMRRGRFLESDGPGSGSAKTVLPEVGRPLWIALDKSDVCSLVDSLVSTMMMTSAAKDDDVSGQTAPSSSAAVVMDAGPGRHGNDDAAVDYSGRHGNGGGDAETALGGHGNGAKRCQRKQDDDDVQCLLAEVAERQPEVGASVESDAGSDVIVRRQDGGSRCNSLSWKKNMLMRLHSQKSLD